LTYFPKYPSFSTTQIYAPNAAFNWFVPDTNYEGWNFNSGNYLFTTDTK